MNKRLLMLGVALLLVLAACNGEDESLEQEETPEENDTEEQEEIEEEVDEEYVEPEFTFPLTGEEAEQEFDRRTLAVQVNNHPSARPQTGLVHADIVYEFLAEGDITRLVALYHSHIPEEVGPVRSARSYYIETAKNHGAIYVYHGAADFIEEDLRAGWVTNLNGAYYDNDQFLFKRANHRSAPHDSYVMLENAYEVATRNNINVEQEHDSLNFMSLPDIEEIDGEQAKQVEISYASNTRVSYQFDESEDGYLRYSDGEQSVDLDTNEPVVLDNVLIYETDHRVIDDVGRRDIDIESGGNGYLLQQGTIKEIEWQTVNDIMVPTIDGEEVELVPGQTWVNVIPTSPGLLEAVTYE
ncbi:DUF3048 domain-containing protein [Alkalibacillus haloalkaliphilus]|uniref:DUF3048 domain-containing protein n=1 Tax=Alkalibacillus haloalkaliphilus TaxID=94136 RepID=UPI0029363754|nr:DUF3048 domain-containing protein [Alkalibacillus haloalkaliphilus]MDV2581709.1 DUF3048 domain-containing protein [Alkalibacillus haloalkaliphilus]